MEHLDWQNITINYKSTCKWKMVFIIKLDFFRLNLTSYATIQSVPQSWEIWTISWWTVESRWLQSFVVGALEQICREKSYRSFTTPSYLRWIMMTCHRHWVFHLPFLMLFGCKWMANLISTLSSNHFFQDGYFVILILVFVKEKSDLLVNQI